MSTVKSKSIEKKPRKRRQKGVIINLETIFAAVGVVLVWRGVWGLLDHYLFPNNPDLSYIASLCIGLVVLYFDDYVFDELRK